MPFETYLRMNGFKQKAVECVCPHCVTVAEFIATHPAGRFFLICNDKYVPVSNGICFDSENTLDDIVLYYYEGGQ